MSDYTFNFINSVKGGCGKTTFSILLMHYFAFLNQKKSIEKKGLLLDMDLRGTALQYLITGNAKEKMEEEKYLHTVIDHSISSSKSVSTIKVDDKYEWNILFSSPDPNVKALYNLSSKAGYFPTMQQSVFKDGMIRFLKQIRRQEKYSYLIFDMPPSSEGFSEVALRSVLDDMEEKDKEKRRVLKDKDNVNLFFLTSLDAAQVRATAMEIHHFLVSTETIGNYRIFIVFNDIFGCQNFILNENKNPFEYAYDDFMRFFKEKGLKTKKSVFDEIYFCTMEHNEYYIKKCIDNEGLCTGYNEELKLRDVIPTLPVSRVFQYGQSYDSAVKVINENEKFIQRLFCHYHNM